MNCFLPVGRGITDSLTISSLIAGHKTGIKDRYVKRNPQMVKAGCEAIERHYFGIDKGDSF